MKVLIATDGSKFSEAAIKETCSLLSPDDENTIAVVSVVEPFTPAGPEAFGVAVEYYVEAEKAAHENAEASVKEAEEEIREAVGGSNLEVQTKVIKNRFPKNAIVEEARDWGADMIVVGSHGYGFWDRMLLGSVSNAVVHHAPCSVLVVRSEPDESEE